MSEKPKKELPGDIVANLDQFNSALEESAKLMGTYFRSLVDNGVPVELAQELVKELNRLYFSKLGGKPNE